MSDRQDLVWYEIDRLRREADKLERIARRHDDCIMFNGLEKLIDKYAVSFCIGMLTGAFALWMRLQA
ncbi:MAG: hypothetical protein RL560_13 [Actinomycetota bacterium]|jgi:hypothetical protein